MSRLSDATGIAREFHRHYERLAGRFGYETRPESAVPWEDVPQANRDLMVAVVETLLDRGIIGIGTGLDMASGPTEVDPPTSASPVSDAALSDTTGSLGPESGDATD